MKYVYIKIYKFSEEEKICSNKLFGYFSDQFFQVHIH